MCMHGSLSSLFIFYLAFEVIFDCKRIGLINCRTDYIQVAL